MKTLLIVLSLLSSGYSKPALSQNQEDRLEAKENYADLTSLGETIDGHAEEKLSTNSNGVPGGISLEERSLLDLKTPIDMKKGIAYRVYRNLDEKKLLADSKGKCKKPVQFKFCEDETESNSQETIFVRRSDHTTKEEIEDKINKANEALGHIERYLNMKNNSNTDKLEDSNSSTHDHTAAQLQNEFDVFHSVLDNMVKNMENLQMNLHSVTLNNKTLNQTNAHPITNVRKCNGKQLNDDMEVITSCLDEYNKNVRDLIAILNHEKQNTTILAQSRMDQWKDTIYKIQKNVDTGINIADRFNLELNNDKDTTKGLPHEVLISPQNIATESAGTEKSDSSRINNHNDFEAALNDGIEKEDSLLENVKEDAEMTITQDINRNSNLHSDNLKVESGLPAFHQSTEQTLISKSDNLLTATEANVFQKNQDLKGFQEIDDIGFITEASNGIAKHMLQEQGEMRPVLSDMKNAENVPDFKLSELNDGTSNFEDDESKSLLNNIDKTRKSENVFNGLETEIKDFDSPNNILLNKFGNENLPTNQDRSQLGKKADEDRIDTELLSSFAKGSSNHVTGDILKKSEEANSASLTTPLHEISRFDADFKNDLHHMRPDQDVIKNEAKQTMLNGHSENMRIISKEVNNLEKMDDGLDQQLNGHINALWSRTRETDISMPHTHSTGNTDQGMMRSEIHAVGNTIKNKQSSDSVMLSIEKNDVQQNENVHRAQNELSKHEHVWSKAYDEHFHYEPSFKALPNFNSKSGEIHSLRHYDNQWANGRYSHGSHNLRDDRFSSGIPNHANVYQERTNDMDNIVQASNHLDMRQMMQKSAMDYVQPWYDRRALRVSSYNQDQPNVPLTASSSSGAVGLFPNANVGGCAIPLLLSCSPSVVSGTLAKGPSSYTAHSYGPPDGYKYHKKRDIKHYNHNDITKIKNLLMLKRKDEIGLNEKKTEKKVFI
ncbi:protein PFC0760c-like [Battus philenor]|uniref:protein PFC0760c-like n=1 Tax=Battus philenor TaxID=42288 RepID=UPI0035CEEC9B